MADDVLTVAEHAEQVLRELRPLSSRRVDLARAAGLVLAEDVAAAEPVPVWDQAATDGYAVRLTDVLGTTRERPVVLPVQSREALTPETMAPLLDGATLLVTSGMPLPPGTEAVVPLADTDANIHQVALHCAPDRGDNIRRAGCEAQTGDVILERDTVLRPQHLGALAALGLDRVPVIPPPRVSVLVVGAGLVAPGRTPKFGQRPDSNGAVLGALVEDAGGELVRVDLVRPALFAINRALNRALGDSDLIITAGGLSLGADSVRQALGDLGVEFEPVTLTPLRSHGFGRVGEAEIPVIALPGDPGDALVAFEAFGRPAIATLAGREATPETVEAVVQEGWSSPAGSHELTRVRLVDDSSGMPGVVPAGDGVLAALGRTGGFAEVDADTEQVVTGSVVRVRLDCSPR